ncbi:tRNA1(Val) (adenine(37)-N6)-methyltransferase [Hymenobacter arizonensis]|uniref:tRNA1(Val) (adenine(37)-N6)-methyltransferase n=1 Tax=Hymenobacter arizonensis TaxID=1227077 RepID=A0A1I5TCY3_HYMAR|nr:methyltransferase [Hymenobacter arizonensis]SFP80892.1 tRNA1Val (adenine37-N6)-methyltransferase [Hymenobacter arizonensis]
MPNDYFQFQQFRIEQGSCAMKVSTDACLLGAAASLAGATRLLDIGTGTGLLALMAAQRHPTVEIEAVEIDEAAAAQAAHNAAASPWADRIQVRATTLADYAASTPASFSHIICNPPFFRHSLPSADAARNTARHVSTESLSFGELAGFAYQFLLPAGALTVLLPTPEMLHFEAVAQQAGLHLAERLVVRHRPGGRPTRHISRFLREESGGHSGLSLKEMELTIHADEGPAYSAAFRALLSGFYLAL